MIPKWSWRRGPGALTGNTGHPRPFLQEGLLGCPCRPELLPPLDSVALALWATQSDLSVFYAFVIRSLIP